MFVNIRQMWLIKTPRLSITENLHVSWLVCVTFSQQVNKLHEQNDFVMLPRFVFSPFGLCFHWAPVLFSSLHLFVCFHASQLLCVSMLLWLFRIDFLVPVSVSVLSLCHVFGFVVYFLWGKSTCQSTFLSLSSCFLFYFDNPCSMCFVFRFGVVFVISFSCASHLLPVLWSPGVYN